ncbi:DNA polymerase III subunit delta [Desulfomarina sp.]
MTLIRRNDLEKQIETGSLDLNNQAYLFFGERYLCKKSADRLQEILLEKQSGTVHSIDGEQEDFGRTLGRLLSFSLLPGLQIYRVSDSNFFHTKNTLPALWEKAMQANKAGKNNLAAKHLKAFAGTAGLDPASSAPLSDTGKGVWKKLFGFAKPADSVKWADELLASLPPEAKKPRSANQVDQCISALEKGLPTGNILILTAETVDKRQRLFTWLKKNCVVVDCSVATGAGAAALREQKEVLREMMLRTLTEFNKKIEPRALELFFERVGFHPVAVVMEMEKLALFTGEREMISCSDLEEMVSPCRENALFELTDAFNRRQTARVMLILNRLQEQGIHGLAILATMRNFLKKMLIFKHLQLQGQPLWRTNMNANEFQNSYLPQLRTMGKWQDQLKGHPYALFMSFSSAARYSPEGLKHRMELLLEAEFQMKGSPLPTGLILEELFLSMLRKQNNH